MTYEMRSQILELKTMVTNLSLQQESTQTAKEFSESWLTVDDLCKYLPEHPTKQTIYNWIAQKEIPYYKKNRRIRFLKSEVEQWLLDDKKKSFSEIQFDANDYIKKHPLKL